MNDEIAPF